MKHRSTPTRDSATQTRDVGVRGVLACALLILAGACDRSGSMGTRSTTEGVEVVRVFEDRRFRRPVYLTQAPGEDAHVHVVEQDGLIHRIPLADDEEKPSEPFLDLREKVRRSHNEEGLLGLAFPEDYAESGCFYVYYSASDPTRVQISRFKTNDSRTKADPDSEHVLLTLEQPFGNHNGGMLAFGPEGYLYAGPGDGGSAGDPNENGQDPSTLLGTILRIAVDEEGDYEIPSDNPFVDDENARDEIWAYGLRNPWRFSFDRETGELWVGDVGQNTIEEIDVVVRGGNYGWDRKEGTRAFEPEDEAPRSELLPPLHQYGRDEGTSITGGYVYRGEDLPFLRGAYVYGDYGSGTVWALRRNEDGQVISNEKIAHVPALTSFGEDAAGELYAMGLGGTIVRFTASSEDGSRAPR